MKKKAAVPTPTQFLRVLDSRSTFRLAIKGHQCVESALNRAIAASLAHSHVIEIKRMRFLLKVDLAIALDVIELESRPALVRLNTIRNRFAHEPNSSLRRSEAMQLYNALSPRQRGALNVEDPSKYFTGSRHTLLLCLATIFYSITTAVTHLVDRRVAEEEWSKIVQERVGSKDSPQVRARQKYAEPYEARVEARVRQEREKRESLGEL